MQAPSKPPSKTGVSAHPTEGTLSAGPHHGGGALKSNPGAALRLETRHVHGWADVQGRAHVQLELRLANDTGAAVPDVTIACPACEVQTLWNVRMRAAGDPRPALGGVARARCVAGGTEAGQPPSAGPQGGPGFSWKQLWRRRQQRSAAGRQAPAGSRGAEAAVHGACGGAGMQAAGLPGWMLEQGGLPPGGELVFGGIFFTDAPSMHVAPV